MFYFNLWIPLDCDFTQGGYDLNLAGVTYDSLSLDEVEIESIHTCVISECFQYDEEIKKETPYLLLLKRKYVSTADPGIGFTLVYKKIVNFED